MGYTVISATSGNGCCLDSSYSFVNGACTCPTSTTLYQNHCYQCTIANCQLCQTDNVCTTCNSPFVVGQQGGVCQCQPGFVQQGNTCVCPSGQVVDGAGTCVPCPISKCTSCSSISICQTCQSTFVPSQDQSSCVC